MATDPEIKGTLHPSPTSNKVRAEFEMDGEVFMHPNRSEIVRQIMALASEGLAEEIMEHYRNEILAQISPQAIATLAVARAAERIADLLEKKK